MEPQHNDGVGCVVVLGDACSAWSWICWASHLRSQSAHCRSRQRRRTVEPLRRRLMSQFRIVATRWLTEAQRCELGVPLAYIGDIVTAEASQRSGATFAPLFIRVPTPAAVFLDLNLGWARYAQFEQTRQFAIRFEIARLQTISGGWASLRRVTKALACALALHRLALLISDGELARKCRVFIGWAYLWNGDMESAAAVFEAELREGWSCGDEIHVRRSESALYHLRHNPEIVVSRGGYSFAECWASAFSNNHAHLLTMLSTPYEAKDHPCSDAGA